MDDAIRFWVVTCIEHCCACLKPHSALDVRPIRLHAEEGVVEPTNQSTGGIVRAMDTQWWSDSMRREMCRVAIGVAC